MTAADQLNRIVSLIAELSRGDGEATLADLARHFDVDERQIAADIRTLTGLGDHADHDWRLSLSVTQQGDSVSISSQGPWRRPLRLTPDEFAALQVALADEPGGEAVARKLAAIAPAGAETARVAHEDPGADGRVLDVVREAIATRHRLQILYAGSRDRAGRERIIEPHDLVAQGGRFYCVAWCATADGWRHFRVDRMLDCLPLEATFTPRDDYVPPTVVFHAPDDTDDVTVRFSPAIARWLRERYPEGRSVEGGWEVRFAVADPAWLARHVLYFGDQAEVVAPAQYRGVVRQHT